MHRWVDQKKGANVVTLLSHNGKIIDQDAYGVLDYSAGPKSAKAQKDTIFKIMSMTKPTVGIGMMQFYEKGRWKLDDPVAKHIPQFAGLKVKEGSKLVTQKTPMNMAQLMSHSAGFPGQLSVQSATLDGIIPPLVKGQLAFQPGKDWRYGPGVEIQGYLIQKWSGKDLSDYMQENIFRPLGMVDTGFFIAPSKVKRMSQLHQSKNGVLTTSKSRFATTKPKRLSPSGGLYSTAGDYWKFCQMMLNNGTFNGKRILSANSVKLMQTNVLEPQVHVKMSGSGVGVGFGLDFAVLLDPKRARKSEPKGSYYWGGAYGTWFWIDPATQTSFVGMIQNSGGSRLSGDVSLTEQSARAVYAGTK